MLTTDQINTILMDMLLKRKPTITGPEADALRVEIKADLERIDKDKGVAEVPYEIPDASQ